MGGLLGAAASITLLAGCSVSIPDPTPDPSSAPVCAAIMADLPERVLDQGRRRVEPGTYSAAWGRPTITLSCGVGAPPGLTSTSECLDVDGVGWYAEEATNGMIFTTIGRTAYVEVTVPTKYGQESGALVDLGPTVDDHDPVIMSCAG